MRLPVVGIEGTKTVCTSIIAIFHHENLVKIVFIQFMFILMKKIDLVQLRKNLI